MTSLRNTRLAVRLGAGFGLMLLLLAITTTVALFQLAEQNRTVQRIGTSLYPRVQNSQALSYLVMDVARVVRNIILVNAPETLAKNKAQFDANRTQIGERIATLDGLADSAKDRELLAAIKSTGAAYFAYTDKVVALGLANNNTEAVSALFGPDYKAQAAFIAALSEMVKYQEGGMEAAEQQTQSDYTQAAVVVLATAALAVVTGLASAWLITRSIAAPMRQAVRMAQSVAAGDLTTRVGTQPRDEAGQLLAALGRMNDSLAAIVGQVRESSNCIATGSAEIANGNADLSQRTEEQASNLEQTAASMEQLTGTVRQNAETARTATQLAGSASEVAQRGGAVVAQVVGTMEEITASSRRIGDIIGVIDGLAFQTNILALNAAVEAARAGEQGRGFAVVASEVRSLAQRSAEAAKEIKTLIGASVDRVDAGSRLVVEAGSTMQDIVTQVRRVSDLIVEMDSATQEQARGISQIGDAVHQLDDVTQQNAALVEESSAAADSLKQQAAQLVDSVGVFKLA